MSAHIHPYSFADAKAAIERASRSQKDAEQALRDAYSKYAAAERAYRQALAEEILRLKAEGVAWSSTSDLARGTKHVADLRYHRDVADGVKEAAAQVAFRHAADRRELEQLVTWSMRVAPDGQYLETDLRRAA